MAVNDALNECYVTSRKRPEAVPEKQAIPLTGALVARMMRARTRPRFYSSCLNRL